MIYRTKINDIEFTSEYQFIEELPQRLNNLIILSSLVNNFHVKEEIKESISDDYLSQTFKYTFEKKDLSFSLYLDVINGELLGTRFNGNNGQSNRVVKKSTTGKSYHLFVFKKMINAIDYAEKTIDNKRCDI